MEVILKKNFRHYIAGKKIEVTNNLGRELISEGIANEVKAGKAISKKVKSDWKLK